MPAKKIVVELRDAQGQPVADVPVKITGCGELITSPVGTALFLPDEDQIVVSVDGQEVFQGALASAPDRLVLVKNGAAYSGA